MTDLVQAFVQSISKNVENLEESFKKEIEIVWSYLEQNTFKENLQRIILHSAILLLRERDYEELKDIFSLIIDRLFENNKEIEEGTKEKIIESTVLVLHNFLKETTEMREILRMKRLAKESKTE